MAFQFPWTNLHELNLDWFLSKFKQFTDNYLGTTATAESVPYGTQPSVTVTGGELDDDTDITDPFTFNFKIPAGEQGEQGEQGVPGQDGFSPIATVTKSGTVATITITDVNGTTSTTISDGEVTQDQLDTKAPAILSTASGSIANFSDGADDMPISELMVGIVPVQSGSGNPAPDNIRPISGWTGCRVTRMGKNLIDDSVKMYSMGNVFFAESRTGTTAVLPSGKYTFSVVTADGTDSNLYAENTDTNVDIATAYSATTLSFTLTETTPVLLYAYKRGYTTASDITSAQLELGATATDYEPYQSNTATVDWQTEAGTVYGGTLDVKTGVLTVNRALHTVTNNDATSLFMTGTNANRIGINVTDSQLSPTNAERLDIISNIAVASTNMLTASVFAEGLCCLYSGDPSDYSSALFGVPSSCTTAESAKTYLVENGCKFVYKLATPQTYQLTPQQLFNTLYGVNNVWSDTGDSTVTYTADTMLYIQNLTQPTEDDMVANTAIPNGKFFMIGNNLYKATTAIASGSQIIPGTNATPMSLADALNLL